jgi:hypothetical protein
LDKLTVELQHEGDKETREMDLGERSVSENWESELRLTGASTSVEATLEFSLPEQLVGDQAERFSVQGDAGVGVTGGPVSSIWFSTWLRDTQTARCPGHRDEDEDIQDEGVDYSGPELECELEASEIGKAGFDGRAIWGGVEIYVSECVGALPPKCEGYASSIKFRAEYKLVDEPLPPSALLAQPGEPRPPLMNGVPLPYPCDLPMPTQTAKEMGATVCRKIEKDSLFKWTRVQHAWLGMFLQCYEMYYVFFRADWPVKCDEKPDDPECQAAINMSQIFSFGLCKQLVPNPARSSASPHLVLEHLAGTLRYDFVLNELTTEVKTGAVAVRSDGSNAFGVGHDAQANRTTVSCYNGPLVLTPTNSSLPSLTLESGQEVDVSAQGVGFITPIPYHYSFLPLAVR